MPVKHWTRAGLMLTDWCNAACACCYVNCSPAGRQWLAVDRALAIWADLIEAGPHGCRVHLTGGEVFGRFDHLLAVCRGAQRLGLGPLEAVETNGFWATDATVVRERLRALDDAGLTRLTISTDPYHQQFVPIERPRLLARVAAETLGPERVRVRWRDWLAGGVDTDKMTEAERQKVFSDYLAKGRDRLTGRLVDGPVGGISLMPAEAFDDNPCNERLLRGRSVHISPGGDVWPATCVGIVVGNACRHPIGRIWDNLNADFATMPVVGPLSRRGPVALMAPALQCGFVPRDAGYGSKCQLCFELRRVLIGGEKRVGSLGPGEVYSHRGRRACP